MVNASGVVECLRYAREKREEVVGIGPGALSPLI
jgi:hypothetical protein